MREPPVTIDGNLWLKGDHIREPLKGDAFREPKPAKTPDCESCPTLPKVTVNGNRATPAARMDAPGMKGDGLREPMDIRNSLICRTNPNYMVR